MTEVRTALVVGGGIAGPVAAMALRRAGIEASLYEAHTGPGIGLGGMIGIAPNGMNALGLLGLDDAVRDIATPISSFVMQSWTGKRLAQFGGGPADPPIAQMVWRDEVQKVLADEAASRGVKTSYGKRLVRLQDTGAGITALFADGSRAGADILVGADGIRSMVRSLIDPSAPQPQRTGLNALAGFAATAAGGGRVSTGGSMYMTQGKRAFFSYQVLDDGRVGWFANMTQPRPMSSAEAVAMGADKWLSLLREAVADDRTAAPDIVRRIDPADLLIFGALEYLPPVPHWHRGRVVLVGEALNAPSNSSGQGASQAVEDAIQLARCLRDLPDAAGAFSAYEQLRRNRRTRITEEAEHRNQNKAAGPIARVLRDMTMPMVMKILTKPEKQAWLAGYQIDWDAKVGPEEIRALSGK
ncbi:MAG: FAD-dependent monooxygenase [Kutzneria sp.]|nr:FAD-dependent monooxygenase [Kutzneria sp.]MBV9845461.1 FAD-dependent monooxygenase [Kutzneria sp.]